MNKWALILLFLGALPGCSLFASKPPDVTIQERATRVICDTTAKPDALDLKDTPPTLVMDPSEEWGYWFNSELYGAIAENLQAMRANMSQSRAIRAKLVRCIDEHNAAVDSP